MGGLTRRLRRTWRALTRPQPPDPPPEDDPTEVVSAEALDLVLRVGELLLTSGESTERVTESMYGLAVAYELPRCEIQVTLTGLVVSAHPGKGRLPVTGSRAIRRRTPAYWRLTALHRLVEEASLGRLDSAAARRRLAEIERAPAPYPRWLLVTAFGLIAASASVLNGGGALAASTAFGATILGDRASAMLARRGVAEFYQLALAAAIATATAAVVVAVGTPARASTVVTGAILALLPGRALVASIQDGITGDLISASARLTEVFSAIAGIIAGVGLVVYVAVRLDFPIDMTQLPRSSPTLDVVQLLAAAGVSVAFAVFLAAPREVIVPALLGGALIWVLFVLLRSQETPPVLASAVAATVLSVLANLYADRRRAPIQPYVVPIIGPLLPGGMLYQGMVELNGESPHTGLLSLIGALSVGLALAAGVNLGSELVRAFRRFGLSASGRSGRPAARRTRGF